MASDQDTHFAYGNFSESFAQSQDTADSWDPSDEVFARELTAAKLELDSATEALERAHREASPDLGAAGERYRSAADRWESLRGDLRAESLQRPGYISMAQALGVDADTGAELSPLDAWHRRQALESLMAYVCQDGVANLGQCFKNFLAMVRKIRPQALDGITQTDLALLLGERKASVSAREKRRVEEMAKRTGVRGFLFLGGTKSPETRRRCAESAKGNRNRATGARKKRA